MHLDFYKYGSRKEVLILPVNTNAMPEPTAIDCGLTLLNHYRLRESNIISYIAIHGNATHFLISTYERIIFVAFCLAALLLHRSSIRR